MRLEHDVKPYRDLRQTTLLLRLVAQGEADVRHGRTAARERLFEALRKSLADGVVVELATAAGPAGGRRSSMAGKKKQQKKAGKKAKKAQKKAAKKAKKIVRKAKKAVKRAPKKAAKQRAVARKAARPAMKARQQPESLRLRSAGPSFTVSDLHRSLSFYRDVLGFTPGQRWEENGQLQGIELVAGSVVFWLGQDDWKKGRDRVKGLGFRMYCATSQDIDALAARVRAGGGTIVDEPKDESWGGRAFGVRDPDGFTITFASRM
jgi:catechol 2,3-dioxygenase-like lactoylglutathione lyase family enzyme